MSWSCRAVPLPGTGRDCCWCWGLVTTGRQTRKAKIDIIVLVYVRSTVRYSHHGGWWMGTPPAEVGT